jgi:transcriptional regulator with XRE-family HTH domain
MDCPYILKGFGNSLKIVRLQLGISQETLAERANLHRTYISDVERGARNLTLLSIAKLAFAMDVPIATLFDLETQKNKTEISLAETMISQPHTNSNAKCAEGN